MINKNQVLVSSKLGEKMMQYIKLREHCSNCAKKFIEEKIHEYGFPKCDGNTEYISPTDCEEGGIMCISLPKEQYAASCCKKEINHVIWNTLPADKDGKIVTDITKTNTITHYLLFPRIDIEPHYIRYDKAQRLAQRMSPEWDFSTDKDGNIKSVIYDKIRNKITPADRKELTPRGSLYPHPALMVALGSKYVLDTRGLERTVDVFSKDFFHAVKLFKEVNTLPKIPNGALASLLSLKLDLKSKGSNVFLEWNFDPEQGLFIFSSEGVVSTDPDFLPVLTL